MGLFDELAKHQKETLAKLKASPDGPGKDILIAQCNAMLPEELREMVDKMGEMFPHKDKP